MTLILREHVARIVAAHLHVGEHVVLAILVLSRFNVGRVAGSRIENTRIEHAADLRTRDDLMAGAHRASTRHEHVMHRVMNGDVAVLPSSNTMPAAMKHAEVMMLISLNVSQERT